MNTAIRLNFTNPTTRKGVKLKMQSNVPLPESNRASIVSQIRGMSVGQSFFTNDYGIACRAYEVNNCACPSKRSGRFAVRTMVEGGTKGWRVYRIK